MNRNEIKKALYKQNPDATLSTVTKNGIQYEALVGKSVENFTTTFNYIYFNVPLSDLGDASFEPTMPAKLLIRYII